MVCLDCKFYAPLNDPNEDGGECRFNPPVIFPYPFYDVSGTAKANDDKAFSDTHRTTIQTVFPRVLDDYWCGKFEPK